jgi:hypothetical protein
MPHWRTLMKSEHFCAADLWDERADKYASIVVKIVKVAGGEVTGDRGKKTERPFLWLEDRNGKPMRAAFGANSTCATTISQVLGTEDYKKWVGQWIGMYVTKVDGPKGKVDGIRINPKPVPDEYKTPGQRPATAADFNADLTEADKRAIELAEAEEAKRRG